MESKKRKLFQTDINDVRPCLTVTASGDDVAVRLEMENELSALRETLANQQQTIQELALELDEERNAASTAASETMSMILKLQKEKAEVEMEFRQFKRYAEEKMAHDMQELIELDELLLEKEHLVQSLSSEVENYREKVMSFGVNELDDFEHPNLRCNIPFKNDQNFEDDYESLIFDKYTPTTSMNQFQNSQDGIYGMEVEKEFEILDCNSENADDNYCNDDNDNDGDGNDENGYNCDDNDGDGNDENGYNCDDNESTKARVYTIDAIHAVVPDEGDRAEHNVMDGGDIKKLCMRLQVLEADRESMRQAILLMRTEKAQVELLKEIARQFCKEVVPQKNNMNIVKKTPLLRWCLSFVALIQWILSFIFWRQKTFKARYPCGATGSSVGLLLLLDRSTRMNQWRCLRSTMKTTIL